MKIIYRPAALTDLDEIYNSTVQTWGVAQAQQYLSNLRSAANRLIDHPHSGFRYAAIDGVRSIPSGRHLIFYSLTASTITVIRVLHDRMDIQDKFVGN